MNLKSIQQTTPAAVQFTNMQFSAGKYADPF